MNLKNLAMWGIIILLSVGLFNMFQDPAKITSEKNKLPFFHSFCICQTFIGEGNEFFSSLDRRMH